MRRGEIAALIRNTQTEWANNHGKGSWLENVSVAIETYIRARDKESARKALGIALNETNQFVVDMIAGKTAFGESEGIRIIQALEKHLHDLDK